MVHCVCVLLHMRIPCPPTFSLQRTSSHKNGAEEREEAGRVSRLRAEAKTLRERTRDLEKQVGTEVGGYTRV